MIQGLCRRETGGWECTAPPGPLLFYLTNQLFPPSQDVFKKLNQGRYQLECRRLDLWLWANYGACWTNSVVEVTDWWSFRKQTKVQQIGVHGGKHCCCPHVDIQTQYSYCACQQGQQPREWTGQSFITLPKETGFTAILIKLIVNWNTVYTTHLAQSTSLWALYPQSLLLHQYVPVKKQRWCFNLEPRSHYHNIRLNKQIDSAFKRERVPWLLQFSRCRWTPSGECVCMCGFHLLWMTLGDW